MSTHQPSSANRQTDSQVRPPTTATILGLPFVNEPSLDVVAEYCYREAVAGSTAWRCVVTPNVDHIVRYDTNPEMRAVAETAWLVLPDGMPIVWASRLLGDRLRARLTGADLFAVLFPRLATEGVPTVVVASSEGVAAALRATCAVHVLVPPWFAADDRAALDQVIHEIDSACREFGAAVCIVGVSMDKHHGIAAGLRRRWADEDAATRHPIVLLLGASANMYVGAVRRAPTWMQRSGLEWLHRLASDPRRLMRRYLVDDPRFVLIVGREMIRRARSRRSRSRTR